MYIWTLLSGVCFCRHKQMITTIWSKPQNWLQWQSIKINKVWMYWSTYRVSWAAFVLAATRGLAVLFLPIPSAAAGGERVSARLRVLIHVCGRLVRLGLWQVHYTLNQLQSQRCHHLDVVLCIQPVGSDKINLYYLNHACFFYLQHICVLMLLL